MFDRILNKRHTNQNHSRKRVWGKQTEWDYLREAMASQCLSCIARSILIEYIAFRIIRNEYIIKIVSNEVIWYLYCENIDIKINENSAYLACIRRIYSYIYFFDWVTEAIQRPNGYTSRAINAIMMCHCIRINSNINKITKNPHVRNFSSSSLLYSFFFFFFFLPLSISSSSYWMVFGTVALLQF